MDLEEPLLAEKSIKKCMYSHGLAQVSVLITTVLLVVWVFWAQEGVSWKEKDPKLFLYHPLMMILAFVCFTESIMIFKTPGLNKWNKKLMHTVLHGLSIVFMITGLVAVFRFHNESKKKNMYSLHSWLGLSTFIIFCAQYIMGMFAFLVKWPLRLDLHMKKALLVYHKYVGLVLVVMLMTSVISLGMSERLLFKSACNPTLTDACISGHFLVILVICTTVLAFFTLVTFGNSAEESEIVQ